MSLILYCLWDIQVQRRITARPWNLDEGSLKDTKMVPLERLHTSSYSSSVETMVLSCIVCEIKRDIGQKFYTITLGKNRCEYFIAVFFTTQPISQDVIRQVPPNYSLAMPPKLCPPLFPAIVINIYSKLAGHLWLTAAFVICAHLSSVVCSHY